MAKRAKERLAADDVADAFPADVQYAKQKIARLSSLRDISPGARILDVGAGLGEFVAACNSLGYRACGIEPWAAARTQSRALSERLAVPVELVDGRAEAIPFADGSFDVVHANSVLEHVAELPAAFAEVHRVLKPGGIFWFSAASAVCPFQSEISLFPFFGWYPDAWKRGIMQWAVRQRPELVGNTSAPAVNWLTPGSVRRQLGRHGFTDIRDRWDLRREDEGGRLYVIVLRLIRLGRITRRLADMVVPECSYAALK
jgi:ubiquinone/menaquinone biosynthesis C-methylase UbiE